MLKNLIFCVSEMVKIKAGLLSGMQGEQRNGRGNIIEFMIQYSKNKPTAR